LGPGYSAEVDRVGEGEWNLLIQQFRDCSLNQSWAFGAVMSGERCLSRLVLKHGEAIAAAAQVRIKTIPFAEAGIAYVSWGPMWMRADREADPEDFRQAIRALRNEYVCGRGLNLRLFPLAFEDDPLALGAMLSEEGYLPAREEAGNRTMLMDLTAEVPVLLAGLEKDWRYCLRRAEKSGLEIIEGSGEELFDVFDELYKELIARKGFAPSDFTALRSMQKRLPEELKTKIYVCRAGGEVCAGLVVSMMGDSGLESFAATNELGRKNNSSYLLLWRSVCDMKERGVKVYNLNGISPEQNPGTYHFKRGLAGRNGRDLHYLGKFDAAPGFFSHKVLRFADLLRKWKLELEARLARARAGKARAQGSERAKAGGDENSGGGNAGGGPG